MSTGIWAAVSGATAQMAALDVAANNVANVATPGFRADREVFAEALAGAMEGRGAEALRYGSLRSVQPDLSVGRIVHTGRDLDVASRAVSSALGGGSSGSRTASMPSGCGATSRGTVPASLNVTTCRVLVPRDARSC